MSRPQRYPDFSWWTGVVENRDDPAKMGRYQVRIVGHHTQNKEKLPTAHLPWAIPLQPVTSAAISGIGHSPTGLVEGSAVMGFFADGEDGQIPVIMGSFGVTSYLPKEDDDGDVIPFDRSLIGFYDPKGTHPHYRYPKRKVTNKEEPKPADGKTHSSGRPREEPEYSEDGEDVGENILEEADSSRLARGKEKAEEHYSLKGKREMRIEGIPIAMPNIVSGGTLPTGFTHPGGPEFGEEIEIKNPDFSCRFWNEPHPTGSEETSTKYGYNHVYESESGHVFEVDDTLGAERIHEFHRTGTFYEVQPKGDKVTKIVGDDYEIDLKNKLLYIKGDYSVTVDGDYYLNIKGNKIEHVSGHAFQTVRGSRISKIQGTEEIDVESTQHHHIRGNRNVQIGCQDPDQATIAHDNLRVTGTMNVRSKGAQRYHCDSDVHHLNFGTHRIQVYPKFEQDITKLPSKAAKAGAKAAAKAVKEGTATGFSSVGNAFAEGAAAETAAETALTAFIKRSKLELMAQQEIAMETNIVFPDPFNPLSPIPAVSITTARYNLFASCDLYEKIGPLASFTGFASAIPKPGFATRQALIGINNIQGWDMGLFSLLPGIQDIVSFGGHNTLVWLGGKFSTVMAGGDVRTVAAGGMFNVVVAGGITDSVVAGGIVHNVFAGGIFNNVLGGSVNTFVAVGAIVSTAVAGVQVHNSGLAMAFTAGGAIANVAGGAITNTAAGAFSAQAGAAATITAAGAITATATGAGVFAGGASTNVGGAGPTTITGNPIAIG